MYVKDTVLLKQKKRFVMDITGFVFNMSSQVKVDMSNIDITFLVFFTHFVYYIVIQEYHLSILSVSDEDYYVSDEDYYVSDEDYYVSDEDYSRNASCALNVCITITVSIPLLVDYQSPRVSSSQ